MTRWKRQSSDKDGKRDNHTADVDPIIGETIAIKLKSLFDDLSNEPVPDRFDDLIDRLEEHRKTPNAIKSNHSKLNDDT